MIYNQFKYFRWYDQTSYKPDTMILFKVYSTLMAIEISPMGFRLVGLQLNSCILSAFLIWLYGHNTKIWTYGHIGIDYMAIGVAFNKSIQIQQSGEGIKLVGPSYEK